SSRICIAWDFPAPDIPVMIMIFMTFSFSVMSSSHMEDSFSVIKIGLFIAVAGRFVCHTESPGHDTGTQRLSF
ncbi:MAG: hypothetical protein L6276_03900, partial [Acetobacterium sp.]|nr:hypothetical protein [Acetobacterium sp.]